MMIHDITVKAGRYKKRIRVGRGEGGGRGKQSGRGNKGAGSRSGTTRRAAFEGGQMPLFRRLRKYGFSNAKFRTEFWAVNLGQIMEMPAFKNGGNVDSATLIKAGLVRDDSRPIKILGGLPKGEFLREFEPDFFFDDQTGHVTSASLHVPAGHVNSGVSNPVTLLAD